MHVTGDEVYIPFTFLDGALICSSQTVSNQPH